MRLMPHTTLILLAQGWQLVLLPLHLKSSQARGVLRGFREL